MSFLEHMMGGSRLFGHETDGRRLPALAFKRPHLVENGAHYLIGDRQPFDLMAWNADRHAMPYRMHSEYLRRFFSITTSPAAAMKSADVRSRLRDIHGPFFAVSTITDHVAPWRSVYKIQMLTHADVTFVLSNGGHNAGVVNPPGRPGRYHQIATHKEQETYVDPDAWQKAAGRHEGSWWPCWRDWLIRQSSKEKVAPSKMAGGGKPLGDAPGTYVLEP